MAFYERRNRMTDLSHFLTHMQLDACAFLQIADHVEEIACLRIAARTEHADQAFGLGAGWSPSFSKPMVALP